MNGCTVRRVFVADLLLELRVDEVTTGVAATVRATWVGGPLSQLEPGEVAEAEAGRLKAAHRFARDLGLQLHEVTA